MGSDKLRIGVCLQYLGESYKIQRIHAQEQVVIATKLPAGVTVQFPIGELTKAHFDGTLTFSRETDRPAPKLPTLEDYPPHVVAAARLRLEAIRPLLKSPDKAHTTAEVRDLAIGIRANPDFARVGFQPGPRTLRRWLKYYSTGGHDIRSLIPHWDRCGGKGRSRLSDQSDAITLATIEEYYLRREHLSAFDILAVIVRRIEDENRSRLEKDKLPLPSLATVYRRIAKISQVDAIAAHKGREAKRQALAQYAKHIEVLEPLERVQIDHTPADVIVIDETDNLPLGRPTLTLCIDVATRYPLGFYLGFEPPSYLTVMSCLSHAIRPKAAPPGQSAVKHEWLAYGVPRLVAADTAPEFRGNDLADACNSLGIVLEHGPVKRPECRPFIERMFGSLNSKLFHSLPGTTFSRPAQRGDYKSVDQAVISLSELTEALLITLLDIYAVTYHRGLGGRPEDAWKESLARGFLPATAPSADLNILLRRTAWRTVMPSGISFEGIRYNSSSLASLRLNREAGQKHKIKYDPSDMGSISVLDPSGQYIEVPALDTFAHGISLWKLRVIRQYSREKYHSTETADIGRAIERISELIRNARNRKTNHKRTNKTVARLGSLDGSFQVARVPDLPPETSIGTINGESDGFVGGPLTYPSEFMPLS